MILQAMLRLKMLLVFISTIATVSCVESASLSSLTEELSSVKQELGAMREEVQELSVLKEQVHQLIALNLELQGQVETQQSEATMADPDCNEIIEDQLLTDDIEDRLEKLEELSRVGTLRSCNEYSAFGIKTSGQYKIDPDGILIGEPPFTVNCQFDGNGGAVTEIFHNAEDLTAVEHCHDPGCYSKNITYTSGQSGDPIPLPQIEALIALSARCEQSFYYECTLAPLRDEGLDYGFWIGRDGEKNVYFTGADSSLHACDCHFTEEGCEEEELKENTCNCDSSLPVPLLDTGKITNMSALPLLSIYFGGLNYEIQQGSYKIGRLSCKGEKSFEKATSCEALKLAGETNSGYFTVKKSESLHTSTVFCDMSAGGYDPVPENTVLSTNSPLGTITAWIPRNNITSGATNLPDGWLPCDGRVIEKGPWLGGRTPDLNTDGFFLRGGTDDNTLEMEDDQIVDHLHTDPGHTHSNSPHSHTYQDTYADRTMTITSGSSYYYGSYIAHKKTSSATTISIANAKTNIGGVSSGYNSGTETRPRNMKVMWIIKLW